MRSVGRPTQSKQGQSFYLLRFQDRNSDQRIEDIKLDVQSTTTCQETKQSAAWVDVQARVGHVKWAGVDTGKSLMWSVPLEALEGKRLTCGARRFVYAIWERRIKIGFVLKVGIAELEDFKR
ncbi:hypothetical protein RRG08_066056 [Elysia crispata]|uniref:Uncharacterized protein n=1 Tax=Elysia crispata TaxID=231223 RepID=A0AAE1CRR4_9GAST|nr:hypothetical protein RRG08_066056 [Elysia crispata]